MNLGLQIDPPIKALVDELNAMKEGFGETGIMRGLVAGSAPMRKAIKAAAPKRSGALGKSIGYRRFKKSERAALGIGADAAAIYVGPTRKVNEVIKLSGGTSKIKKRSQQYKANWFENTGTKAHVIIPRKKGGSLSLGGLIVKKVKHPGMKRKPFISVGIAASESAFESRFYSGLISYVEKQRAKRNS